MSLIAFTSASGALRPVNSGVVKIGVENLDFYYGKTHALKNVSLGFNEGEITAIIGPSGCGKSTLLRTMNRIYDLYPGQRAKGAVTLGGRNILDPAFSVAELRARVGMVFQKPTPFSLSIFDNIAFALRHYERLSRQETQERVETSLKQAALWDEVKDKLNVSALALSGGQQQRVCIARALAVRPEIVLLDEPTSALDPISTAKIEELLVEQAQAFTFIVVTHNLQQAARLAHRTAFMLSGELVEVGDREQIFVNPVNNRTRDYVTGRFG